MPQPLLRRLYLRQTRAKFILATITAVGLPGALGLVFMFRNYGGFFFFVYLVLVALVFSALGGFVVWEIYAKHVVRRISEMSQGSSPPED